MTHQSINVFLYFVAAVFTMIMFYSGFEYCRMQRELKLADTLPEGGPNWVVVIIIISGMFVSSIGHFLSNHWFFGIGIGTPILIGSIALLSREK